MRALVPDSIKPSAAAKSIVEPLRNSRAYQLLLLMLGMAITLLGGGYQFGLSNHTVYLIAPLREINPEILKGDWWATSTLQYHAAFTQVSAVLMKWGIIQEVFLLGYLALVVLLHLAWWKLNRLLGGSGETYLLSVIFFYISAAGFGLGLYRFLQDSAMLPSNIANVAMLWAICFYAQRRIGLAGLMLGLSGLFHLNHAIVAPLLWAVMTVDWLITTRRIDWRWWAGCAAALGLSVAGIAPVFREILNKSNLLPLGEFVDLYVRLRHPHHYEPATWAWPYWLAFLWPIPLALLAFRRMQGQAAQKIRTIFLFFMVLQLVALIFAGVWFVHEWLIQMSLYRFSIFPKLISCIGAAILLINYAPRWSRKALLPVVILSLLAVMILNRGRGVLLHFMPQDDMEYVAMCNWASDPKNTPRDAIFIVPPHEHCFRLYAQRAIVVNMKAIPQLSGELAEWRRRLEDVLGPESMRLDHQFDRKLRQIEQSYESLPAHHLAKAARKYNARYIVIAHEVTDPSWHLAHTSGRYRLYQIL